MDSRVIENRDDRANTPFVTEYDATPAFWNYLAGLNPNDLIAELIQNDLDQGANLTVISFERTRLICEGNGAPVDSEGWQRLRKIQGAGDQVPAKRNKFGVKNHGLNTAFTIGDEIRLMSDGKAIVRTLYKNGRKESPYPGASECPMEDRQAPAAGCRVIVSYRDDDLEPIQGEAIKINAVDAERIELLFRSACASIPEQFAGVVSPEITPKYEIVLRHWEFGEVRFLFSCTRTPKIVKRMEVFQRRCVVSGTFSPLPEGLCERAVRRFIPLRGILKERVADYFRRKRHYFIEVSWPIDTKGKPKTGTGKFRYPIGYPLDSHEARTGHGTYFNAPFSSDNKRHAPAQQEATFGELRKECESLLIDALAYYTIPRWKADGLKPVVPSADADDGDEVVRPILAALAKKGKIPVVNYRQATELAIKRKRGKRQSVGRQPARRYSKQERQYRFVVPALTWAKDTVHPSLSLLCPCSERQLHPRVHTDIVRLLADCDTPGFAEDFIRFDENDVFDRVTASGNQFFRKIADPDREFSESFITKVYLDLIKLALDENQLDAGKEDALVTALLLPDIHGRATTFLDLYSNVSLPSDIPGLRLPPILDPKLAAHALFRRRKWKIRKFTMGEFLANGTLQAADDQTRSMFWKWLCSNSRHIAVRDRSQLADLIIWPDENDSLCKISDLCDPRSRPIENVLAGFIRRPHEQVRRSKLVSVSGRKRTSVRRVPTGDEVAAWLDTRLAQFEIGSQPGSATTDELYRFEADLAILLKNRSIASLLKEAAVTLPALARDGSLRRRTQLVIPSPGNGQLFLPHRYLLKDRKRVALLDKLSPALNAPTPVMLLDAFAEDPGNISALQPRLKEFISITESDSDERRTLAGMAIIPVADQLRPPSALALPSNKGDYWGDWKTRISVKGLSQNDQRRYRAAGVSSALPKPETSQAFFGWLQNQDQDDLRRHIPLVLRHILHQNGPTHWAPIVTGTPCIPTRSQDGLRLVSLQTARHRPVFLSDAGGIGDAVIQKDHAVLLVIDHVEEVTMPISEQLRKLGIRSLRETLKEPKRVVGTGDIAPVSEEILALFHNLQHPQFKHTFWKRLNELEVKSELVRHDWHNRLRRVQQICLAKEVEARYRFRNKFYLLEVDAGFDPETGVFWMKRGIGAYAHGLYESVAKQLVFKPTARPIDLLALEHAVVLEIADPSFGRPAGFKADSSDDDIVGDDTGGLGHDGDEDNTLGEAVGGHSPFTPDPERNKPQTGPISNGPRGTLRRSKGESGSSSPSGPRQAPDLEKKHKEDLKRQYASHCQMCLCKRLPQELAPTGSYIEWEEVRRKVVEAHHPDLVSAGGARHAGNLLLLCKLHHDNYGRRFTRAGITAALRDNPKRMSICFGENSHVMGRQIEFEVSGTGEIVKLFFTDDHVEYWLSQETVSD